MKYISIIGYVLLIVFLAYGIPCNIYWNLAFTFKNHNDKIIYIMLFVSFILLGFLIYLLIKNRKKLIYQFFEGFILILLPISAFIINLMLPDCSQCQDSTEIYRPLHFPDMLGLYLLYLPCCVAYYISRRRQERLVPITEMFIIGFLLTGILLNAIVYIQLNGNFYHEIINTPFQRNFTDFFDIIVRFFHILIIISLLTGYITCFPLIICVLFSIALMKRLSIYGKEEIKSKRLVITISGFILPLPIIGLWSLLQQLIFSHWPRYIFTKTCSYILSLDKLPPCENGHYLCTVAATGHRFIVRPLRFGYRGGQKIIVNRQLCIANAFEDLLHCRWPKLGRFCRKWYDRLGLPISKYIKNRWAADIIYLLMKPAEWIFFILLLLLDPENPEKRIDSMYRFRSKNV